MFILRTIKILFSFSEIPGTNFGKISKTELYTFSALFANRRRCMPQYDSYITETEETAVLVSLGIFLDLLMMFQGNVDIGSGSFQEWVVADNGIRWFFNPDCHQLPRWQLVGWSTSSLVPFLWLWLDLCIRFETLLLWVSLLFSLGPEKQTNVHI